MYKLLQGLAAGTHHLLRRRWSASLILCTSMLGACSLPPLEQRTVSQALDVDTASQTKLGKIIAPDLLANPGSSGIHPLYDAQNAFAARAQLARMAERTLDVQYYIWRADSTGMLLLDELRAAGDRGVRVRLLLDDLGTSGLDDELMALSQHPNIEVRLFNPSMLRTPKMLGYLGNLKRANRRMHNKSFTADNQATIIGGRNVGDEYFGATEGVLFADLDVLAIGPVVNELSQDFDKYWASASSAAVEDVLAPMSEPAIAQMVRAKQSIRTTPHAAQYIASIERSSFIQGLYAHTLPFEWATVQVLSDDPAKGVGQAAKPDLLVPQLQKALGPIQHRLDVVSAYFVPGADGVKNFGALAGQGVKVRILTNAYESTDVPAVHAGYGKRRKPLLEAGVTLYELRQLIPSYAETTEADDTRLTQRFGSSGSSLHAKTFAVDGRKLFVGSFNFDPRSANLNTELGFLIHSPVLAQRLAHVMDNEVPRQAYRVFLGEDGGLRWQGGSDANFPIYEVEPNTNWWSRAMVRVLGWLPIEWLL
ncbi:MAG: phospholipase D family protein [Comamonas sp.]